MNKYLIVSAFVLINKVMTDNYTDSLIDLYNGIRFPQGECQYNHYIRLNIYHTEQSNSCLQWDFVLLCNPILETFPGFLSFATNTPFLVFTTYPDFDNTITL